MTFREFLNWISCGRCCAPAAANNNAGANNAPAAPAVPQQQQQPAVVQPQAAAGGAAGVVGGGAAAAAAPAVVPVAAAGAQAQQNHPQPAAAAPVQHHVVSLATSNNASRVVDSQMTQHGRARSSDAVAAGSNNSSSQNLPGRVPGQPSSSSPHDSKISGVDRGVSPAGTFETKNVTDPAVAAAAMLAASAASASSATTGTAAALPLAPPLVIPSGSPDPAVPSPSGQQMSQSYHGYSQNTQQPAAGGASRTGSNKPYSGNYHSEFYPGTDAVSPSNQHPDVKHVTDGGRVSKINRVQSPTSNHATSIIGDGSMAVVVPVHGSSAATAVLRPQYFPNSHAASNVAVTGTVASDPNKEVADINKGKVRSGTSTPVSQAGGTVSVSVAPAARPQTFQAALAAAAAQQQQQKKAPVSLFTFYSTGSSSSATTAAVTSNSSAASATTDTGVALPGTPAPHMS